MLYAYINGVQYDAEWDFEISEQSGNKTSTTISVRVEDQPIPLSGDIIQLIDEQPSGNTVLFWGVCGIPKSPEYETGLEWSIYEITCGNANSILSYRIANVAYQGYTISQIVQALFTQYIQAEGITLGQISNIDLTLEVYTAKDMNLQDVLNELADYVGAVWEIRADRTFWFLVEQDFPQFPQVMNMGFFFGGGLQSTTKDYKQRTVQYISGATDFTSPQTETFSYDGEQQSFTLAFPVSSQPAITVNGTPVPSDLIGVSGLSASDQQIVFTFSNNSQTISYKENSNYLTQGDTVVFTYTGIFPVRVVVTNDAKISEIAALTGTSGRREMVQIANNVTTQADAITLAQSLLTQFETYTEEIKFFIYSDQLAALGMTLSDVELLTQMVIDLPSLGISGTYVITERVLTPAYGDMTDPETKLQVDLKLMSRNYVKSYGEVISDLRRDINQLAIRPDDIVVNVQTVNETEALTEQLTTDLSTAFFCTLDSGPLFAPLDLGNPVYPDPSIVVPQSPYPLPDGYTMLEYIESTGQQYIDTGVIMTSDVTVKCTFQFTGVDGSQCIFGSMSDVGVAFAIILNSTGNLYAWKSRNSTIISRDGLSQHYAVMDNFSCTLDGEETLFRSSAQFSTGYNAYIFARNSGDAVMFSSARIYQMSVISGSQTVRDFIPCVSPDGEAGLYDTVTQTFFQNLGESDFLTGQVIPYG